MDHLLSGVISVLALNPRKITPKFWLFLVLKNTIPITSWLSKMENCSNKEEYFRHQEHFLRPQKEGPAKIQIDSSQITQIKLNKKGDQLFLTLTKGYGEVSLTDKRKESVESFKKLPQEEDKSSFWENFNKEAWLKLFRKTDNNFWIELSEMHPRPEEEIKFLLGSGDSSPEGYSFSWTNRRSEVWLARRRVA